jgi:HlyD family secretion protein
VRNIGIRLLAGAAPLAALVLSGCGAAAPASKDPAFEAVAVEQRPLDVKVEASGTLQPPLIVEVKSKASGQVLKLFAQTGDEVKMGQLLANIDPRDVRNAYSQAVADLDVAKAQLATSTEQLKRDEALRKSNVITAQEYEQAVLAQASAKSQLVKGQVNLELAQQKLGDVTIEAPLNATVIEKSVEVGTIIASASQTVSGGTTLFKIANTDTMQVKALVDETDIGRVQANQSVAVSVEAYPGRTFPGHVLKIEPEAVIDQNVTMFPVIVEIDNGEKLLKTGMNADVQIQVARRDNALVVPNDAVVSTREAVSVGTALGLAEEQVQKVLDAPIGGDAAGPATPGAPGAPAAAGTPGAVAGAAGAANGAGGLAAQCQALRAKFRSGSGVGSLSAEDRATMGKCRELFMAAMGGGQGGQGGPGGGRARGGQARPGIVFVQNSAGAAEPRRVMLGVNDWDYTEVVRGLKVGDKVILASVARIQQATTEMQNQIRQRSSPLKGNTPGGGGRGPGGR